MHFHSDLTTAHNALNVQKTKACSDRALQGSFFVNQGYMSLILEGQGPAHTGDFPNQIRAILLPGLADVSE